MAFRILALGDSYTAGEGVHPGERWPDYLADLLRAGGRPTAAPQVLAECGWSTGELHQALREANPQGPFDLVAVMVGVNDHYRGGAAGAYGEALAALLADARPLLGPCGRLVVVSIPDWTVTPFAEGLDRKSLAAGIAAFNAAGAEQARRAGAVWVDVAPVSRRLRANPRLLLADGLHPSPESYREWAQLVLAGLLGD